VITIGTTFNYDIVLMIDNGTEVCDIIYDFRTEEEARWSTKKY
jgi:hypothetical protein